MKTALDLHRLLLDRGVTHEVVRLRRAVTSAADLPRVLGVPDADCVATHLFLSAARTPAGRTPAGRTHPGGDPAGVAAATPVGRPPVPSALARAYGQLRPATHDEVNRVADFCAALLAPLGLPDDIAVVLDSAVAARAVVYLATGEPGTALGIVPAELVAVTGATVCDVTHGLAATR